eukprot:TRINITY_DN71668_c0_g1_i1.p1 TRINITY_DN71668_c0_g1~~TRINITY_DN71668_c0_g1_i1.p1  ORF type:complete len:177 (-),score=57.20 TRINITY_DN71668_c0_g1_i1:54-584(-)
MPAKAAAVPASQKRKVSGKAGRKESAKDKRRDSKKEAASPAAAAPAAEAKALTFKKVTKKSKVKSKTYKIDCSIPANDGILDAELLKGFEQFLLERIKVNGRTGRISGKVTVQLNEATISITSRIPMRKSYVKYLTKKYLKKKTLRDWLRIVSNRKDSYELRYFNIHDQDEAEEQE